MNPHNKNGTMMQGQDILSTKQMRGESFHSYALGVARNRGFTPAAHSSSSEAGVLNEKRCKELPTRVEYNAYVHIWRLLSCNIPRIFTKQVEEINAIFGQQQIENIHYTISLIDKNPKQDKLDQLVKQNITKCMKWCIDHSLAYNNLMNTNLFEGGNKSNKSSFDSLEKIHQVS
jgi:hypothetical protein